MKAGAILTLGLGVFARRLLVTLGYASRISVEIALVSFTTSRAASEHETRRRVVEHALSRAASEFVLLRQA